MNIDELMAKLRSEGRHEMYPPASQADIEMTETALGRKLPDSFKRFVGEFSNGAYLFEVQEVSAVGDGNPAGNEYAVAYLDTTGRKLYGKLDSFDEWLSILVKEQDEVIRTLYGDDVIYDELDLG